MTSAPVQAAPLQTFSSSLSAFLAAVVNYASYVLGVGKSIGFCNNLLPKTYRISGAGFR